LSRNGLRPFHIRDVFDSIGYTSLSTHTQSENTCARRERPNTVQVHLSMKTLIIYYIFYEFFDFLTTSYAGMFRGLGMQSIISWANFVCFYIISIPLCYLLVYPAGLGIYGNWISYLIAIIALVFLYSYIYLKKVDFHQICYESKRRLSRDTLLLKSQINADTSDDTKSQDKDI